nr:MAG TPA: hypothetical protein [Caudoviricetes sp.]
MSNQEGRQQAARKIMNLAGTYVDAQYPGHKITTMVLILEAVDENGESKLLAMNQGSPIAQNILVNSWLAARKERRDDQ